MGAKAYKGMYSLRTYDSHFRETASIDEVGCSFSSCVRTSGRRKAGPLALYAMPCNREAIPALKRCAANSNSCLPRERQSLTTRSERLL